MILSQREVRLRPEFAEEYPDMPPGVWMPATELARRLVERARARRKEGRYTRTFDPTHFEFRGGDDLPRSTGDRTRSTDAEGGRAVRRSDGLLVRKTEP